MHHPQRGTRDAQHVAIGQMRAAETGRPVVQAAISGISALRLGELVASPATLPASTIFFAWKTRAK